MTWLCVLLGCCAEPLDPEDQAEAARSSFAAGIIVGAFAVAVISRLIT